MTAALAQVAAAVMAVSAGQAEVPEKAAPEPCQTKACDRRVRVKRMRRVIRPYRHWLRKVRICESGGDYTIDAFHDGAYQMMPQTWRAAGGKGFAYQAGKLEQDYRAVRWAQMIGWGNVRTTAGWPNCG